MFDELTKRRVLFYMSLIGLLISVWTPSLLIDWNTNLKSFCFIMALNFLLLIGSAIGLGIAIYWDDFWDDK